METHLYEEKKKKKSLMVFLLAFTPSLIVIEYVLINLWNKNQRHNFQELFKGINQMTMASHLAIPPFFIQAYQ